MNDQYNGWTNRETWAAHLHITADCSLAHLCTGKTGPQIRDEISELFDDVGRPMPDWPKKFGSCYSIDQVMRDIGSLWRVNWDEIAKALSETD